MRPYELLVVAKPGMGAEQLGQYRSRLEAWLGEAGARVEDVIDVGELPLSYEIRKQTRGHYLLFWFEGETTAPENLNVRLRVDEDTLRYLITARHPLSIKAVKPAEDRPERSHSDRFGRADRRPRYGADERTREGDETSVEVVAEESGDEIGESDG